MILSVFGLNLGYTVKFNPLPSGVPSGFALGNSFRQGLYVTVYPLSRPNTDTFSITKKDNIESKFPFLGVILGQNEGLTVK